MQFDLAGFLIFIGFILPGFVAQKARDSIIPRSLKPSSPVADVGEFVLAGVLVHSFLLVCVWVSLFVFSRDHLAVLENTFRFGSPSNLVWTYRNYFFLYFIVSLAIGYLVGGLQGWLILRQPVRNWLLGKQMLHSALARLGIFGFLQERSGLVFRFSNRGAFPLRCS